MPDDDADDAAAAAAGAPSVAGGWLCLREERDRRRLPVRFEATFTEAAAGTGAPSGGAFGGAVVEDGGPHLAVVPCAVLSGLQVGRHVRFDQMSPSDPAAGGGLAFPIHYRGTLSGDGRAIAGTWERRIRHAGRVVRQHGTWEGRRLYWPDAD